MQKNQWDNHQNIFDLQCIHIPDSSSRHNDIMQSLFESPVKGVKINYSN